MERLIKMSKERFVEEMRAEMERVLGQVADAVNNAPDGYLINGSEMQVRDLMGELRKTVFEKAVQMRIDETEGAFSPSEGHIGQGQAEQGSKSAEHGDGQRTDRDASSAVVRQGRRKRRAD